jgi:hypothetical protein
MVTEHHFTAFDDRGLDQMTLLLITTIARKNVLYVIH